jgi:hypothetical protein
MFENNLIHNCSVTSDDARWTLRIYGPDIATLKGKTVKHQNRGIPNYQPIQIPAPIIAKYSDIRIFMDIFWVNGSPFFHTISQWIKFRTIAPIENQSKRTLLMETQAVVDMYEAWGFSITWLEADQEFKCLTADVLPINLNVADADDHVHEVERPIQTINERTRCTVQGLPFRRIPKIMMRGIIEGAHKALNQFLVKDGVSEIMSPLTIMTGKPNPDFHDLKIEFGAYALVYEDNDPTNTNKTRSTGAITLTPTGNAQGGYFFMSSLATRKRLSRQQWDELTMPDGVIAIVEAMAEAQEQHVFDNGAPVFEWSPEIANADEDEAPITVDLDEQGVDDQGAAEGIDIGEDEDEEDQEAEEEVINEDDTEDHGNEEDDDDNPPEPKEACTLPNNEGEGNGDVDGDIDVQDNEERRSDGLEDDADVTEDLPSEEEEEEQNPRNNRYNLRPKRDRNYDNRLAHIMDNPNSSKSYDVQFLQQEVSDTTSLREVAKEMQSSGSGTKVVKKCITGFIMTQMTAKAGHYKKCVLSLTPPIPLYGK